MSTNIILHGKIAFVGVPKDARDFDEDFEAGHTALRYDLTPNGWDEEWLVGYYKILSPDHTTITEEQAATLGLENFGVNGYLDYRNNMPFHEYLLDTALESFQSLTTHLQLDPNLKWVVLSKLEK